jgi:hypothetical protein
MVAVEYPDLSGEAENAENPNQLSGVPRGARPAGESADQVRVRDMSFDVDTDDPNQVEYENREAFNIAAENFRRFANGLNLVMAQRSGEEWLVLEYNDLFFAFVKVGSDPVLPRNLLRTDIGAETEINEAEINSAGMLCSLDPKLWMRLRDSRDTRST